MTEIIWLSHGGPGSGRYPKGSGKNPRGESYKKAKKKVRNLNKLSKKDTILKYQQQSKQLVSDAYKETALLYNMRANKSIRPGHRRKMRNRGREALQNKMIWDEKVSKIKSLRDEKSSEMNSIKKYINDKLNVPLKTVKKEIIVDVHGLVFTSDKYTKYKIDKKKLKNGLI